MTIRGRALHALLTRLSPGAMLQSQLLPPSPGDLVLIGDGLSIHGAWEEWFPSTRVRALGDEGLLIEDAHQLVELVASPQALVLLLGTADLLGFGGSSNAARAASRLDTLVARAVKRAAPAPVLVVGVPSRPVLATRSADFNRAVAALVSARGAVSVPASPTGAPTNDGFALSALRWDASVYSSLAHDLGAALGIETATGRLPPRSATAEKGFVDKMARKGVQLFETLPPPEKRVVLFGDSITAGGFWDAWLPEWPVANRGIGDDTIAQLSERIDSAISSPRAVSLLAGTNDLLRGNAPKDSASIAQRFRLLVASIREREPDVPLVINSVMPRAAKYSETITTINAHYRDIAKEFDAHYLDLWPTMATPQRTLRKALTPDGLHLNGQGYRTWVRLLRPTLTRLLDGR